MERNDIWQAVEAELRKAKKAHPSWPKHPCGQAGIVVEEAGELMKACIDWKYHRDGSEVVQEVQQQQMRDEAIQVIVTAYRFLENL